MHPWEAPLIKIRFRLPHNCISPPIYPRNYPFQVRINVVELSRTQDGFRSTQMMNIADFRWTHHANTPMPATPTSMQRFLSPPPLKSCNKLTLVNRQTNKTLMFWDSQSIRTSSWNAQIRAYKIMIWVEEAITKGSNPGFSVQIGKAAFMKEMLFRQPEERHLSTTCFARPLSPKGTRQYTTS